MYNVLLVDDEPLILSGIKFLIEWESVDCCVVATARNGQQALDVINDIHPDIVICDINMPILSGLQVIEKLKDFKPAPVFIMLTNHQEFEMTQEALRYNVADYILKFQLDEETLIKSLHRAISQIDRRGKIDRVSMIDKYVKANHKKLLQEAISSIFFTLDDPISKEVSSLLEENNVLHNYAFARIFMNISEETQNYSIDDNERKKLFDWQRDLVEKLAENVFSNFVLCDPTRWDQSLTLFAWGLKGNSIKPLLELFYKKVDNSSKQITKIKCSIIATDFANSLEFFTRSIKNLELLSDYYFNSKCDFIDFSSLPSIAFDTVSLQKDCDHLAVEIRNRNINACEMIFDTIAEKIALNTVQRLPLIYECTEMYTTIASIILPMTTDNSTDEYFTNYTVTIREIKSFSSKDEVLHWFIDFKNKILSHIQKLNYSKSNLLYGVQLYVQENIDKKIMLQDIAKHINISSAYLSSLFKKNYNKSLVDYINEEKIAKACKLIEEGSYRINEIANLLGFDNAYYFTRVFKKHKGLTPREYQSKIK